VDEVTDGGPDSTEQARQAPRHPQLLHAPRQQDRLHAVGHQVRPARYGCDPEILGSRRKRPQELLDVRLVAGALTAEDVRVDQDERRAQANASR